MGGSRNDTGVPSSSKGYTSGESVNKRGKMVREVLRYSALLSAMRFEHAAHKDTSRRRQKYSLEHPHGRQIDHAIRGPAVIGRVVKQGDGAGLETIVKAAEFRLVQRYI